MRLRFFNTFEPVVPLFRDLLPHLVASGHMVDVVLTRQAYRHGERRGDVDGIRFRHMPTLPSIGRRGVDKLLAHGAYGIGAALYTALGHGADLNVFMTQPPMFHVWGRMLGGLRGQPYCAIVMDLYPWVAMEAGVVDRDSLWGSAMTRLSTNALRAAAGLIVIGRCMAERVGDLGVARERIHVIPNWANTDVVKPIEPADNPLREAHGLGDKIVVMYSGNLGVSHYFDDLLEVADRLRRDTRIVLLFVGDGARKSEVERASSERDLPNIRWLDYQDYDRLDQSLSLGDVHFVSLRRGFEGLLVPSKSYGALAAGRPIIYQGSANGEIARMINEHDAGAVIPQGDVAQLEAAIRRAADDEQWRRAAGARARAAAEGEFGSATAIAAYERVFNGAVAC